MREPGAKSKLLSVFQVNVGRELDKDFLAQVAGVHDWARSIRTLRQEGHDIELLQNGSYRLNSLNVAARVRRGSITRTTRYRILHRDNSTCQRCGRTPADGVKLAIDHKIPVEWGGETEDTNLWVLCEECNHGKKHWLKDENADEMKKILEEQSGSKRLEMYFDLHPNELLEPSRLALVSGIRDWERALRAIRQDSGRKIQYHRKHPNTGKEGYVYERD